MQNVTDRLRIVIAENGLTQADLAKCIGVTAAQASRWLSGINAINQPVAMAIELALGYRWQWILTGEGEQRAAHVGIASEDQKKIIGIMSGLSDTERSYLLGVAETLQRGKT